MVRHPDGSFVSEFEDGTRFTVSAPSADGDEICEPHADIIVECTGFARVCYNPVTLGCNLHFPDGAAVACSTDGSYTVHKEGDYKLSIEPSGRALYRVPNAMYMLDHTSLNRVFHGQDSCGNTFSMQADGKALIDAPNPIKHAAFDPRYFLFNADKSCFELHDSATVDEIISQAKANPKVAVVRDSLASEPSITSTTVIEPLESIKPSPVTVAYQKSSIVPYNLRNGEIKPPSLPLADRDSKRHKFGALVGRGLEIGTSYNRVTPSSNFTMPLGLKYRQFLHMEPLAHTREQVHDILASFINQRQEHIEESETMQPTEMRSSSEVDMAQDLSKKLIETKLEDLSNLYAAAITSNKKESFHAVPASISDEGLEFIEKSKAELKAAENTRVALRNKVIPPYFESKYVKEFLPLEAPDMAYLTSRLAQPPPVPEVQNTTKSQSTLQSSSLTLTLDESDSVIHAVSPSVKTQLTQSTNHTHEVRPNNPTPMKAVATDDCLPSYLEEIKVPGTEENVLIASGKLDASMHDVTGQPRAEIVPKPAALLGARPGEELNEQVNVGYTYV